MFTGDLEIYFPLTSEPTTPGGEQNPERAATAAGEHRDATGTKHTGKPRVSNRSR